ncbi:hypothetical protein LDG_6796 [Legionella drancourtii LLAP12]|uniref:Uncharacterized protein n=1 Tax=Legionella drancourtii LLAP12 TaxID=658187 RepID=G9ENH3_9GAMM|nr:hypothetical protein LDG_6796 [Legionella drancourtii LLAP12]
MKEITQEFLEKIREENILENTDKFEQFSELFNGYEIPNGEQLKQILFDEELS